MSSDPEPSENIRPPTEQQPVAFRLIEGIPDKAKHIHAIHEQQHRRQPPPPPIYFQLETVPSNYSDHDLGRYIGYVYLPRFLDAHKICVPNDEIPVIKYRHDGRTWIAVEFVGAGSVVPRSMDIATVAEQKTHAAANQWNRHRAHEGHLDNAIAYGSLQVDVFAVACDQHFPASSCDSYTSRFGFAIHAKINLMGIVFEKYEVRHSDIDLDKCDALLHDITREISMLPPGVMHSQLCFRVALHLDRRFIALGSEWDMIKSVELLENEATVRAARSYTVRYIMGITDVTPAVIEYESLDRASVSRPVNGSIDDDDISVLFQLASVLRRRSDHLGHYKDLRRPIQILERLCRSLPTDSRRPTWLVGLGKCLEMLVVKMDDGLIERVAQVYTEAVQTGASGPSNKLFLANFLYLTRKLRIPEIKRFAEVLAPDISLQNYQSLEEYMLECAISALRKDNQVRNARGRAERIPWLVKKYQVSKKLGDFDLAMAACTDALRGLGPSDPKRLRWLSQCAILLNESGRETDRERAIKNAREALKHPDTVHPFWKIDACEALLIGCASKKDWRGAFDAVEIAVHLLSRLSSRIMSNDDKLRSIWTRGTKIIGGMGASAASLGWLVGKGMRGLQLLEESRGILAASVEEMRTTLGPMQSQHPLLEARLIDLRAIISSEKETHSARVAADRELELLYQDIRCQPGLEGFLGLLSIEDIQRAAQNGAIVVVNVCVGFPCGAFLIQPETVRYIILEGLTYSEIVKWELFLGSQNADDVEELLIWLWEAVADPVLTNLGYTEPPSNDEWPHIWWVMSGLLNKFPLHAAGDHLGPPGCTVLDRVMSSYSASIKSLITARQRPAVRPIDSKKAVLVGIEHTKNMERLPSAPKEVAEVERLCKSVGLEVVLPLPRTENLLLALQSCSIFHFAGHGQTDFWEPSQSRLVLDGDVESGGLTVSSLVELNLTSRPPFLAYLSACGTGSMGDSRFAEESIHLIQGCQLAGFRHVIGTLWEVNDEACKDITKSVYEHLLQDGLQLSDKAVCLALHDATRAMRYRWRSKLTASESKTSDRTQRNGKYTQEQVPCLSDNMSPEKCAELLVNGTSVREIASIRLRRDDSDILLQLAESREARNGNPTGHVSMFWVPYVHFGA